MEQQGVQIIDLEMFKTPPYRLSYLSLDALMRIGGDFILVVSMDWREFGLDLSMVSESIWQIKYIEKRERKGTYKKIASLDARLEGCRNPIACQFLVVRRRIVGRINASEAFQHSRLCKMSRPFLFPGGSIKEKRDFEFHDS